MAQLSCIDDLKALDTREVAQLTDPPALSRRDGKSGVPYLVTAELADQNDRPWRAIGGGDTLEEAVGFACRSAPNGQQWRIVRVADLYGD